MFNFAVRNGGNLIVHFWKRGIVQWYAFSAQVQTHNVQIINSKFLQFLPPAKKLREGNVFTPVCHSVHRRGLCPRGSLSGRPTPYGTERVVRILLECILVDTISLPKALYFPNHWWWLYKTKIKNRFPVRFRWVWTNLYPKVILSIKTFITLTAD